MIFKVLMIVVSFLLGLLNVAASAQEAQWAQYVEFRDAIKEDTIPSVLSSKGSFTLKPWTDEDKADLERQIEALYGLAPGLFRLAAEQGTVPLYRIDDKAGNSYGAYGALWFANSFGADVKNYLGVQSSLYTLAHELTHVADVEFKISRSDEFRSLTEPRIEKLRAAMQENGFANRGAAMQSNRFDIPYDLGLPSFYAGHALQEALAEYATVTLLYEGFTPPDDIREFLERRLFRATPQPDPSIELFRRGKLARLRHDNAAATVALTSALQSDSNFVEAYMERGLAFSSLNKTESALEDFSSALRLMSDYDWKIHTPYLNRAAILAGRARYAEALADLEEGKRLAPDRAPQFDRSIAQMNFMLEMEKRRQSAQ